ncbi:MAG TPA: hypothetical protein VF407_00760, partial [Polyangiaceae bacterium]
MSLRQQCVNRLFSGERAIRSRFSEHCVIPGASRSGAWPEHPQKRYRHRPLVTPPNDKDEDMFDAIGRRRRANDTSEIAAADL